MRLEEVGKSYGMVDYLDNTGKIYELSKAIDNGDGTLNIPVRQDGVLIGYAKMNQED